MTSPTKTKVRTPVLISSHPINGKLVEQRMHQSSFREGDALGSVGVFCFCDLEAFALWVAK